MLIAIIPLIVALAGLVVFLVSDKPKAPQIGLALFTAGMIAVLMLCGGSSLKL